MRNFTRHPRDVVHFLVVRRKGTIHQNTRKLLYIKYQIIMSVFSFLQFYVMCQLFLMIPHDEVSHVGPVSAVLFIILAFQNGLSTLQPAARLVRLGRNIVLLLACFLHFVHNAVDPVLMSLAARFLSIYQLLHIFLNY